MLHARRRVTRESSPYRFSGIRIRQAGFTLVEILVVLGIIGLLCSLILPAITSSRESTRRIQCATRLRNLGQALLSFHTSHGRFPVGAVSKPDLIQPNNPHNFFRWSTLAYITPYLEEQQAHDLINFDTPMYRDNRLNPAVTTAVSTRLSSYLCPSDPGPIPISDVGGVQYGMTNYVVCSGSGLNGGTPYETDGVFFVNSEIRMDDISDGTSHTVMASESLLGLGKESMGLGERRLVNASRDYATPLLFGADASLTEEKCKTPQGWNIANRRGFFWASGEYRSALYNHHRTPNDPTIDCIGSRAMSWEDLSTRFSAFGWRGARSNHAGGVNVLAADGSVHFVDDSIDADIWRGISTREKGDQTRIP